MKKYDSEYFRKRDILIPHLAQVIKDVMRKKSLKKVLDVGCGTGLLVKYLNENKFQALGCDLSREAVIRAKKINKEKSILLASATQLPYKASSFDLVTSISTIEHLKKHEAKKFIEEARRILAPTGYIFLVTPNFATPIRLIQGKNWFGYSDPTHISFFTPTDLQKLLEKYGFWNFVYTFPVKYHPSLDWGLPASLEKLPSFAKQFLIYSLFSTPLAKVRNSFWILAQKK